MPEIEAFLRGPTGGPPLFKLSESVIGVFTRAENGKVVPEITADGSGLDIDLDGCFEKLGRAQEHLESVHEMLGLFFEADPYGAISEGEVEHGWHVFKIEVRRKPPLRLGVVMGEYAHQVRSAFDHFAFALARAKRQGKQPKGVTGFPMATNPAGYARKAGNRLEGHIPDDWATFIKTLQPYDAPDDPLALLENFWNIDKHQTVVPLPPIIATSLFASFYPHVAIKERKPRIGATLEHGAEIARGKPLEPQPHMDMYCEATVEIETESAPRPGAAKTGFFFDLIPAETMLRFILSTFEAGRREQARFKLTGRFYRTAITSLSGGRAEARSLGFTTTL